MGAVWSGSNESVNILIQAGDNVNSSDLEGSTVLMQATCCHHNKCVRTLLKPGAHVNIASRVSNTALMNASSQVECMELLMQTEADENIVSRSSQMALMWLAGWFSEKCAGLLISCAGRSSQSYLHFPAVINKYKCLNPCCKARAHVIKKFDGSAIKIQPHALSEYHDGNLIRKLFAAGENSRATYNTHLTSVKPELK